MSTEEQSESCVKDSRRYEDYVNIRCTVAASVCVEVQSLGCVNVVELVVLHTRSLELPAPAL
jgi:hypothetical protein